MNSKRKGRTIEGGKREKGILKKLVLKQTRFYSISLRFLVLLKVHILLSALIKKKKIQALNLAHQWKTRFILHRRKKSPTLNKGEIQPFFPIL